MARDRLHSCARSVIAVGSCGYPELRFTTHRDSLRDDAADHTVTSVPGRVALVVVGFVVDDECGAVSIEQAIGARLKCHVLSNGIKRERATRRDVDIRQIAGMHSHRVFQTVLLLGRIEVPAGGCEWRFALPRFVNMKCMHTRRRVSQTHVDQHSVGRLSESGVPNRLSLGLF
jgi:hypothetical protein